MQAGSKVDENTLRLDFTYHGRLSDEIISKIEEEVNNKIEKDDETIIENMPLDDAKKMGAMALFEDKYDDIVRVVKMGSSIELCGGTHVTHTQEINKFAIISVENKGADTFRIEATTDKNITDELFKAIKPYNDEMMKLLEKSKKIIKDAKKDEIDLEFNFNINNDPPMSYKDVIYNKYEVENLKEQCHLLEKQYMSKKAEKSVKNIDAFIKSREVINDIDVVIAITNDYDNNILKQVVDAIGNKLGICFVLLANVGENKVNFICKKTFTNDEIDCGAIVKDLSLKCLGNGGGNKNYAQGGGTKTDDVATYLAQIKEQIKNS